MPYMDFDVVECLADEFPVAFCRSHARSGIRGGQETRDRMLAGFEDRIERDHAA
jgi:hypothetical protein